MLPVYSANHAFIQEETVIFFRGNECPFVYLRGGLPDFFNDFLLCAAIEGFGHPFPAAVTP